MGCYKDRARQAVSPASSLVNVLLALVTFTITIYWSGKKERITFSMKLTCALTLWYIVTSHNNHQHKVIRKIENTPFEISLIYTMSLICERGDSVSSPWVPLQYIIILPCPSVNAS